MVQVQTGGNFAAVIEGQAAPRREVRDGFTSVNGRLDALGNTVVELRDEMRASTAQISGLSSARLEICVPAAGR
ncbi:hypothetical protein OV450_8377 [Actinobacteria bacterium OV450]|nr:hypothetical protein OV450_8377 [Actinobacteria bacterium OV450]